MSLIEKSRPEVIETGRKKISSLQKNSYLHNRYGNYTEIGGEFKRVEIAMMDSIISKIIQKQQEEELLVYNTLGVSGIQELNKVYAEMKEEDTSLIESNISDILSKASLQAFGNLNGLERDTPNEKAFESTTISIIEEMVDENFGNNKDLSEILKKGLNEETARFIAQAQNAKKKPKMMDKYIDNIANKMQKQWSGIIIQNETGAIMQQLVNSISGKRGNIQVTGSVKNSSGKPVSASTNINFNNDLTIGIQTQELKMYNQNTGDINFNLSGSLEEVYYLLEQLSSTGINGNQFGAIKSLIRKFKTPEFKYHLINQAAFVGIADSNVSQNILDFIKMCLPIFLANKIIDNMKNVSFITINNKFVPISEIMQKVFLGSDIGISKGKIYSTYKIPWIKMLREKISSPKEDGYYSEQEQSIGGFYGKELYKGINVGRIHLKVALANIK